ncbi:hypothetical protein K469DRAFT_753809 [Zopfia rhizophila CBS 207.26]|uniref:Rhodopsin domain-containing protein n=1 Tax=Zopfia rhizophila CBS 207.26 TaxID=1314779 RepID=A0A6A6DNC3_9PEZI|nr:hypothetical protein K469DRAFT_753809 [Zopfia rhizophila CBS 207.26]
MLFVLSRRSNIGGILPPPPGITPNFVDPPSRATELIVAQVVFTLLSTVIVAIRVYTALAITRNRWKEEYVIVISWVSPPVSLLFHEPTLPGWIGSYNSGPSQMFAVVFSVMMCYSTRYGYGRHAWDIPFALINNKLFKVLALTATPYGMSIMLAKVAILLFYLRFVTSWKWIYACRPLQKYWDFTITDGSCLNWQEITIFSGAMNSLTDFIILVLPLALLRDLKSFPMVQRIGVMLIMMTGGFVLVISVVRAKITSHSLRYTDLTWESIPETILWIAEMHLAVVCACLPVLKPFIMRFAPKCCGEGRNRPQRLEQVSFQEINNQPARILEAHTA